MPRAAGLASIVALAIALAVAAVYTTVAAWLVLASIGLLIIVSILRHLNYKPSRNLIVVAIVIVAAYASLTIVVPSSIGRLYKHLSGGADPNTELVVIQSSNLSEADQRDIRETIGPDVVKEFAQSRTQLWRVGREDVDRLAAMYSGGRIVYFEMAGGAPLALTANTVDPSKLTSNQRAHLAYLFEGAAPSSDTYRLAEAMPEGLSADLLSDSADLNTPVSLPLLGDDRVTVMPVGRDVRSEGDFTWRGLVSGGGEGSATLVVRPAGITGFLQVGNSFYQISPLEGGRHVVRKIRSQIVVPDHPPGDDKTESAPATPASRRRGSSTETDDAARPCSSDSKRLDILVGYTPAVAAGRTDVVGVIRQAEEITNGALRTSGLEDLSVRVVGTERWTYTETGIPEALEDLTRGRKGLAIASKSRDTTRADVVMFLIKVPVEVGCGRAARVFATPARPYAVINQSDDCLIGNFSFAHELGHLLGVRHDPIADRTNTPFAHGHGYVNGQSWRTILAYPGACNNCVRMPFFSNPLIRYPAQAGDPTGDRNCCDEARVIRQTFGAIAAFRCSQ